jgi:uncharacterized membrane protein YkvA (DUF1232 family)
MRGLFSILLRLPKYMRLSWRLMKDPQVPWYSKLIVMFVVLYAISPIDLIPEYLLPHLGFGDDLLFFLLSIQQLIRSSPKEVVTQHAKEIAEQKTDDTTD